jgi:four helix bundle protein
VIWGFKNPKISKSINQQYIKGDSAIDYRNKSIDMNKYDLQKRAMQFHVDVIKLCGRFPKNAAGFETAKQLIRSAGSVGANYRAACRAKSNKDFVYKIEVVLEEADESLYWLQVSETAELIAGEDIARLIKEANELVSIFNASDITAKKNRDKNNTKDNTSANKL